MWREKKCKNFSLLSLVSWFSFLGGECCVKDATINMDIGVILFLLTLKKNYLILNKMYSFILKY